MALATFLWEPDLPTFLLHWIPIILMATLVWFLFRLMRNMPRTKPA